MLCNNTEVQIPLVCDTLHHWFSTSVSQDRIEEDSIILNIQIKNFKTEVYKDVHDTHANAQS